MRTIVCRKYGSPEVLQLEQAEIPAVGDDDILVKVRAVSLNPYDWHMMRGIPYFMRLSTGYSKPKNISVGNDFAGTVERVGKNIVDLVRGDDVFGGGSGALADYLSTSRASVIRKPSTLTFEQASAIPIAALTAMQGLRDKGQIEVGQRLLINGASGGVGSFAVQIAKAFGAEVTGVCSTKNVHMVRELGADHVIDYTQEDFTRIGRGYDLVFDAVGNRSLLALRRLLAPNGILVMVGGAKIGRIGVGLLTSFLQLLVVSRLVNQKLIFMVAKRNPRDLAAICGLVEAGKLTPFIDRTYPFQKTADAMRHLETGHARGKVIVTL